MDGKTFEIEISDDRAVVYGHPELEGRNGCLVGDGMAFFWEGNGVTMNCLLPIL